MLNWWQTAFQVICSPCYSLFYCSHILWRCHFIIRYIAILLRFSTKQSMFNMLTLKTSYRHLASCTHWWFTLCILWYQHLCFFFSFSLNCSATATLDSEPQLTRQLTAVWSCLCKSIIMGFWSLFITSFKEIFVLNVIVRGVARNLLRGTKQGVWGWKPPARSRAEPRWGSGGKASRSWRHILNA